MNLNYEKVNRKNQRTYLSIKKTEKLEIFTSFVTYGTYSQKL